MVMDIDHNSIFSDKGACPLVMNMLYGCGFSLIFQRSYHNGILVSGVGSGTNHSSARECKDE